MSISVLLVQCPDRPGLMHGITGVLFELGLNVVSNQEFVDRVEGWFHMRTEFEGDLDADGLEDRVRRLIPESGRVRLSRCEPKRVVVLVSKEHHCLADTLVRHEFRELNASVQAVVANHETLGPLARRFDVPFVCVPHAGLAREEHEAALIDAIEPHRPDYLVLAKYMRVLSADFVGRFPSRIVNIHHSFLPAFAGARPYHQAYARGVKVIGATAHFVTADLDAGPILVQQVIPVDHSHTPESLVQAGRDVEQMVLAKALRLVFEDRVFLCGNRTIIFD